MSKTLRTLLALAGVFALLAALVAWLNLRDEDPLTGAAPASSPDLIARGAYLARAGNCMGCHTERGGAEYAGGRGVPTPFGTIYAPNLTPDPTHGLGAWTGAEFWRALHNGRARDGRLLYPAFPYPNYTRVTRADADAIFEFLRSLPPVAQPNRAHTLQFPFDRQAALAVWRALYFPPARPMWRPPPSSPSWPCGSTCATSGPRCPLTRGHASAPRSAGASRRMGRLRSRRSSRAPGSQTWRRSTRPC